MRTSLKTDVFAILCLLSGGLLLLANFLAAKIWHLGPVILDGGILVFPIIYIVGDLLVELFGQKSANRVAFYSCALNLIALVSCLVVNFLPALDGANEVDLAKAFGLSARVMFASCVGFIISSLINNSVFEKIRQRHAAKTTSGIEGFTFRALASSFIARIFDTTIFSLLAFAGRTSPAELLIQIVSSFAAGMLLEVLVCPLSRLIAKHLRKTLQS